MADPDKPTKKGQDLFIMAALLLVIAFAVDFASPSFLDIAILVLAAIWIALTIFKWRKSG
ncbi:hypothetical protein IDH44_13655 [Paenibacillus sp. IB182496]|uniref:Uncharacterized protein n=1 Tax=Paenibacillus sabuli TaxID=2772509 RepID=A0A927BUQ6_9BACL|nr:hypothetical protein [Paenibacillus sabuli]MBD2846246.1 hypothetical protein [Paenibacillus sabuli]